MHAGEKPELRYYLFTHIHFDIHYNGDRVIEARTNLAAPLRRGCCWLGRVQGQQQLSCEPVSQDSCSWTFDMHMCCNGAQHACMTSLCAHLAISCGGCRFSHAKCAACPTKARCAKVNLSCGFCSGCCLPPCSVCSLPEEQTLREGERVHGPGAHGGHHGGRQRDRGLHVRGEVAGDHGALRAAHGQVLALLLPAAAPGGAHCFTFANLPCCVGLAVKLGPAGHCPSRRIPCPGPEPCVICQSSIVCVHFVPRCQVLTFTEV